MSDMLMEAKLHARRIADAFIKEGGEPEAIAVDKLAGRKMPKEQVMNICKFANRAIKNHYLSSPSPAVRKTEFNLIDPEKVASHMEDSKMEKTASAPNAIDMSIWRAPWEGEEKVASDTFMSVEKIASQFERFEFIHEILTKYAHPTYYKSGDIVSALNCAIGTLNKKASEAENISLEHRRNLEVSKRAALDIYRKACLMGVKEEVDKVAMDLGIYADFLLNANMPQDVVSYDWRKDKPILIETNRDLTFELAKVREHADAFRVALDLAKNYGILSSSLRQYVTRLLADRKWNEINSMMTQLQEE